MNFKYLGVVIFAALGLGLFSPAALAVTRSFQFTNLLDITGSDPAAAEGAAYIVRNRNYVEVKVMAADLTPGNAYTMWFVFFNRHRACAGSPCADTDLMNALGAIHFAASGIASADGTLNIEAKALAGGAPEGAVFNPNLPRTGLMPGRGLRVEVHLVLVDHGRPMPGILGADDPTPPGSWAWELTHSLPPGPMTWVRAAIFVP